MTAAIEALRVLVEAVQAADDADLLTWEVREECGLDEAMVRAKLVLGM